jgi:hypothetical protein
MNIQTGYDILSSINKKKVIMKNLFAYSFKNYKGLTVKSNPFHFKYTLSLKTKIHT